MAMILRTALPALFVLLSAIGYAQSPDTDTLWRRLGSGEFGTDYHMSCASPQDCVYLWDTLGIAMAERTTDGGVTWNTIMRSSLFETPAQYCYRGVAHPAPDVVFIYADTNRILRTTDAGVRWDTTVLNIPQGYMLEHIVMANKDVGYVTGYPQYIFRTTNGGESWSTLQISVDSLKGLGLAYLFVNIQCPTPNTVSVMFGSAAKRRFIVSHDQGQTWQTSKLYPTELKGLYTFSMADSLHGWGAGGLKDANGVYTDVLFKTVDGGITWTDTHQSFFAGGIYGLSSVSFCDTLNGLVCGDARIYRTTDGGTTWRRQNIPNPELPHSLVQCILASPEKGYASGFVTHVMVYDAKRSGVANEHSYGTNGVHVYPNPSTGQFIIRIPTQAASSAITRISLYDAGGRLQRVTMTGESISGGQQFNIISENLPSGMYTIQFYADKRLLSYLVCITR